MAYSQPPHSPYGNVNEQQDYFTPLPGTTMPDQQQAYHRPQRQQSQYASAEEVYNMYSNPNPGTQEDYSHYERSIHSNRESL